MKNKKILYRSQGLKLRETETESEKKIIEGYFVVFDDPTELWAGAYEQISKGAIDLLRDKDVRALADHDTAKVLGRTTNNTLTLRVDDKGLFGEIEVNENDTEALNLYARVQRGDINQCSFGFYVEEEETEERDDGSVLWTIKKLELIEVSVVTFPAYANTSVEARHNDYNRYQKKKVEIWKKRQKEKLNGKTKSITTKK